MNKPPSRRRPGFTLVELMTVIAIIVLLVGILIPALHSARTQAKQTSTAGLLSSVDRGCELFRGELRHYPQSRGPNPFEDDPDVRAMGAQWLAIQLLGVDSRGFVEPALKNDSGAASGGRDGVIDHEDWNDWYSLTPTREYTRLGPYADVDGKSLRTVGTFEEENPDIPAPVPLADQSEDWSLGRLPFFVDAFGYPVLYYRANAGMELPFTTRTPNDGGFAIGQYDQADNAWFTGSDGTNGRWPIDTPGWDLTGIGDYPYNGFAHALGDFGYEPDQVAWPLPRTFAEFVCDQNVFANTERDGEGRLRPHKPDTFLLISAGKDGVYGTGDDITNFKTGTGE